jgi:hypothetical protein
LSIAQLLVNRRGDVLLGDQSGQHKSGKGGS